MRFETAFNYLLRHEGLSFPVIERIIFSADCYHIHSTFRTTPRLIDGDWEVGEDGCFKRGIARNREVEPFEDVEDRELTFLEKDSFAWVLNDLKSRPDDWRIGNYPYRFVWQRAVKEKIKVINLPFIRALFMELENKRPKFFLHLWKISCC